MLMLEALRTERCQGPRTHRTTQMNTESRFVALVTLAAPIALVASAGYVSSCPKEGAAVR